MDNNKIKVISFIGRTNSGKGTQSKMIANKYPQYKHISTGEILRDLGDNSGKIRGDEYVLGLLEQEMKKYPNKKFLVDGFPRTVAQYYMLIDKFDVESLIEIKISEKESVRRNEKREKSTGRVDGLKIEAKNNDYNNITYPIIHLQEIVKEPRILHVNGQGSPNEVHERIRPLILKLNPYEPSSKVLYK